MTSPTATAPAVPGLVFTDHERLALADFLAGYRGPTRDAYALDLRQFVAWCERQGLRLFSARRAETELYARWLEEAGRARATVARRLCTVAGSYRYAEEQGLVPVPPAAWTSRRGTPASRGAVTKACRRVWGPVLLSVPARQAARD